MCREQVGGGFRMRLDELQIPATEIDLSGSTVASRARGAPSLASRVRDARAVVRPASFSSLAQKV